MDFTKITPDDPRLTAYALGEMESAERAEFERLLADDAGARAAVEEIRSAAMLLGTALETEPAPAVRIELTAKPDPYAAPKGASKVLRFPQLYFMLSSAAAACFTAFFIYWSQTYEPQPKTRLVEVPLNQVGSAEGAPVPEAANESTGGVDANLMAVELPTLSAADATQSVGSAKMKQEQALASALWERADRAAMMHFAASAAGLPAPRPVMTSEADAASTEAYARFDENPFLGVMQNPLSTFSIDTDTAAYANVRRFLTTGQRPPKDAVRIEELINYFPYRYAPPSGGAAAPFAAHLEVAEAPWAPEHRLVRIGLKGRELSEAARPAANLVFLLDVSGSMNEANKLPLVKQSMQLLLEKLRPDDRVAIVVYAGASGLALPSTSAREKAKILAAVDALQPGGSTNGEAGIQLAYDIAKANFISGGVNRVLLATDGDFNVGVASEGELTRLIEEKAKSGVFLTVLGFGLGNLKDSTLEQLADRGNGQYAYIDTLQEARKMLVEQAGGTLVTIAKDVKIQVEFNPAQVQAYRLIGYENRALRMEDFSNDRVDAGEIGAGHTVTALYEVVPVGVEMAPSVASVDSLKYQAVKASSPGLQAAISGELLTVKVRYKEPAGDTSRLLDFPLRDAGRSFAEASADFKFAASVAAFGMVLRDSPHKGTATLSEVAAWAQDGLEQDAGGHRSEFLSLVKLAKTVDAE